MNYRIDFDREVKTLLTHLPPQRKQKLRETLQAIAKDPQSGKPLQDDLSGYYSFQIGTLRIIYSIDRHKGAVHVVALGPRRSIYEDLERELIQKRDPK